MRKHTRDKHTIEGKIKCEKKRRDQVSMVSSYGVEDSERLLSLTLVWLGITGTRSLVASDGESLSMERACEEGV